MAQYNLKRNRKKNGMWGQLEHTSLWYIYHITHTCRYGSQLSLSLSLTLLVWHRERERERETPIEYYRFFNIQHEAAFIKKATILVEPIKHRHTCNGYWVMLEGGHIKASVWASSSTLPTTSFLRSFSKSVYKQLQIDHTTFTQYEDWWVMEQVAHVHVYCVHVHAQYSFKDSLFVHSYNYCAVGVHLSYVNCYWSS